ncbi:MAG: hypothetical protein AAGD10_13275 [Myxococcota bacterium]
MRRTWALLAVLGVSTWAGTAHAGVDIRLAGTRGDGEGILFRCDPAPCQPDNAGFRSLMTELAYVVAPRIAGPAETLGHSGFELGLGWAGSFVSNEDWWRLTERGQDEQAPTQFFNTLRLDLQKGLPLSLQVGAHVQWVLDSQMVAPGIELRWAFQEGYAHIPDFSLRAAVNTLLGTRDFDLTTFSADFVVSKGFTVGRAVRLAPYLGWSILLIDARSEVIDPTPTTFVASESGLRPDVENDFVFADVDFGDDLNQRVALGLRATFSVVAVGVQGDLQLFSDGEALGPVGTVSTQLALSY